MIDIITLFLIVIPLFFTASLVFYGRKIWNSKYVLKEALKEEDLEMFIVSYSGAVIISLIGAVIFITKAEYISVIFEFFVTVVDSVFLSLFFLRK